MVWTTYKEKVKRLSVRIVEAQRPIRILESIRWDPAVDAELKKSNYKAVPKTKLEYFETLGMGFDPQKKIEELKQLAQDVEIQLGLEDELTPLLKTIVLQYLDVVEMLKHRGTKRFWEYSRKLYGSPKDSFYDDKNTVAELGKVLYSIFGRIDERVLGENYPDDLDAQTVVKTLNQRFQHYFADTSVQAKLSDGILADASAGGDVVKIKEGALFSARDVDILEVHEGWVHVGTTQNGNQQHVAKWLSKGPPRVAATQEGLAVIMEIFTFRSYPRRARQINDRILGIDKAEDGATIVDVIEFYRTEGYTEEECLANAKRVFRGGVLEGGAPFTKDLSYCRGFVENYNFMRAAIRAGKAHLLPFFFSGKLHVDDIPLIYKKYKEGIIDAPRYLPPQFKDLNGLSVWMGFSSFLNMIDLKIIQEHYDKLFRSHL